MATKEEYDEQRKMGARQIEVAFAKLLKEKRVEYFGAEWNGGRGVGGHSFQEVTFKTGRGNISTKLPDEWVADFPGVVGTEKVYSVLRALQDQLLAR